MIRGLKTKLISHSQIRMPDALLRRHDVAAQYRATQAIRKYGQQRPLIVDRDFRLLADTAPYLAMKTLGYELAKVVTLAKPSAAAIRAVSRLLDCCSTINRGATEFNSVLKSLSGVCSERECYLLICELMPTIAFGNGKLSIRLSPVLSPDVGRTPSKA